MTSDSFPARRRLLAPTLSLALVGLLLLVACSPVGGGGATSSQPTPAAQATKPPAQAPATPTAQPAANPATPAAAQNPATSSVALDACSLLTTEEVQAAIGKAVVPAKDTTGDPRAIGCSYQDATNKSRLASTSVYALTPGEAKGVHEATKGGGRDQVAVAGVGDDAYWDKTFNSLSVLKGRYTVGLSVTGTATDEPLKVAETLASKLLSRLP